jgi:hypothetical protein
MGLDELAALAATGATALVTAMTTSAWEGARSGLARLFARGGEDRRKTAVIQLDRNAELLAQASDPDRVRQGLIALWSAELDQLLRDCPGAERELAEWTQAAQAALSGVQSSFVQSVTAHGGVAIGVQSGNAFIHAADSPPGSPQSTAHPKGGAPADG